MTQQTKLISVIAVVSALVFGGLVFALLKAPSDNALPSGQTVFNDLKAIFRGKADASVVVRMYSDFQCPACLDAEPDLRTIRAEFGDRVKFIWKDFPLITVHANARNAANAARCANAQGRFWEYHDRLFDTQAVWSALKDPKDRFVQFAREAGMNEQEFASCYQDKRFDADVMADEREGEKNGVSGTPTFYINDQPVNVRRAAQWRLALDAALAKAAQPAAATSTAPAPVATSTSPAK